MLKNKTTWLLIIMIISVAFIGGLEQKKTASQVLSDQSQMVLYK